MDVGKCARTPRLGRKGDWGLDLRMWVGLGWVGFALLFAE